MDHSWLELPRGRRINMDASLRDFTSNPGAVNGDFKGRSMRFMG